MFEFFIFGGALIFSLLLTCIWVWALVDCVTRESSDGNDRIVWLLVLIFFNVIGTIVYVFYRRPQRRAELGH